MHGWQLGQRAHYVVGERRGSVYTFINPNVDKAIVFSFSFPTDNNADYKILSSSYGDGSSFDAKSGKVTVPANCYVVIGTQAVNAVESVGADCDDAPVRFFNLQGMEISGPAKGEIHVVRKGGRSYKAVAQ